MKKKTGEKTENRTPIFSAEILMGVLFFYEEENRRKNSKKKQDTHFLS